MILTPKSRKVDRKFDYRDLKISITIGLRDVSKPTSLLRLGIIWVILDPLMLSAIYSFLFTVLGKTTEIATIVIGVMTFRAFYNAFKTGYLMKLSIEPFPLKHTTTKIFLISKITTEFIKGGCVGLTGSLLLSLVFNSPPILIFHMTISCALLSILGLGSGMILLPYASKFGDLGKLFNYIIFLSFFIQPCLYEYNITTGVHREILAYIPFTIVVEFLRSTASGHDYPFDLIHALVIIVIWFFIMMIGLIGADRERWRMTPWI